MPLDQAELDLIKADAANGTINPLIANLSTLGLTLRTAADETTYKSTIEGDAVRRRDTAIYGEVEASIEEVTGIKKNSGEKATDYLKRATEGIKSELQTLKDKKDDGEATKADKARILELQGLLATKDEEATTKVTAAEQKLRDYKVGTEVRVATSAVTAKLVKTLTGEAKQDVIDARLAKFRAEYTPEFEGEGEEEKVVYKKKNGEYANNSKGIRLTTEELLTEVFGAYVDKGQKQEGTGTHDKKKNPATGGNPTAETYAPGSHVKTRGDLMDDLKANGFLKGSAIFTELNNKFKEGLPLR